MRKDREGVLTAAARWALGLGLAAGAAWVLPAYGQAPAGTAPASQSAQMVKDLSLMVGRSTILRAPWSIGTVTPTDGKVVVANPLTDREVLVQGTGPGSTDVLIRGKEGQVGVYHITVQVDREALRRELRRLFPAANLEVAQGADVLTISGTLARAEQAQQLHDYMAASNLKYLDLTTVAGVQQVQLRVVVAEASRTAIRTLGINALVGGSSAFGGATIGPDNGGAFNPVNVAPGGTIQHMTFTPSANVAPAVTLFGGIPGSNLQVFVQALAENQFMRILAEPSLVAMSGQEASFLAGGEFPIPVLQSAGVAATSGITIEYKEFGVRLKFRPTVLGDGTIRLQVAPEVSQLSNGPGAVQIQGFSIPALLTRRAETTLELGSGQTFAIAGLLDQEIEARTSRVPGLGDVPVLGALFRSVRYQQGDTELVVLVTADLVEPVSAARRPILPGQMHVAPSDWELYALGRVEGRIPPKVSPVDARALQESGLDRLRGPGAWATFDAPAAVSGAPMK